jgi:hypothetical protein
MTRCRGLLLSPAGLGWLSKILDRMDDWLESHHGRFELACALPILYLQSCFIDTAIGARSSTRSSMSECTLHSSPLSRHPTSRSRPAKQSSSKSSIPMSPQLLGPTPYRAQTSSLSPCFSLSPIMLSPRCGPVKTMRDYRKFSRGWFWSARD